MQDELETREPDFGRAEERVAEINGTEPPGAIPDEADDEPEKTAGQSVREIVRDHPVAGAVGALTGAATGTLVAGAPGTVVGAATGAARGVVVAEAVKRVTEHLENVNLLEPEPTDDGSITTG